MSKETQALQPGPELDAWLAVNVKGWSLCPVDGWWLRRPDDAQHLDTAPCWSTDRGLCWEIVEAMKERGWYSGMSQRWPNGEWMASFVWQGSEEYRRLQFGFHSTPAGAIALAARAAIEAEELK